MNKNPNTQTAVQKVFASYTRNISELVLQNYGPSYATQEEVRNRWRNLIPYSDEIESFLIFQTKMFIRFLDSRSANSTNPQFLESLVKLMADYLSAYTMQKSNGLTRKKAKEILKSELYDKCSYIQKLLARQAANRETKNNSQRDNYKQQRHAKRSNAPQNAQRTLKNAKAIGAAKVIEIKIKSR